MGYSRLRVGASEEQRVIGCKVCNESGLQTAWGRCQRSSARISKKDLVQHAKSKFHRAAIAHLAGNVSCDFQMRAPSATDFRKCIEERKKGLCWTGSSSTNRRRVARMVFCLGEAILDRDRNFIEGNSTVAWFQDGRRCALLVTYRGANSKLEVRSGVLGITLDASGSVHILKAMRTITEQFATPRFGVQQLHSKFVPSLQTTIQDSLRKSVVLWCADAASDEQRAVRLSESIETQSLFPSLKIVLRDRTHASARLVEYPWSKIDGLREALQSAVLGRNSMVSMIQYSPQLQAEFNKRCQRFGTEIEGSRVKGLNYAKQRFSSMRTPLARFVVWFEAILSTTECVFNTRAKDDKIRAGEFLATVDEQTVLLAAMAADAGDESLCVLRYFDSPQHDVTEVSSMLDTYRARIDYLFLQKGATTCGYTACALKALRETRAFHAPDPLGRNGRQVRSIGGPSAVSDGLMDKCYSLMSCWVKFVLSTLACEFPCWELMQSFRIFSLQLPITSPMQDDCDRLSQVLGFDDAKLKLQIEQHQLYAAQAHKNCKSTSQSWTEAVHYTSMERHQRGLRSSDQLEPALQVLAICTGATSSCVEQAFSSHSKLQNDSRSCHSDATMQMHELKICRDIQPAEEDSIINSAQLIWAELFAPPRSQFTRHAANARLGARDLRGEKTCMLRRRATVKEAVQTTQPRTLAETMATAEAAAAPSWSARAQQAESFLQSKARRAKATALADGHLLEAECTTHLDAMRQSEQTQNSANDEQTQKKRRD